MLLHNRWAQASDMERIIQLLPRLADYELPPNRSPEVFWQDDAQLVREWAEDQRPNSVIRVAVDEADVVFAVAIVTYRPDHFSGLPNAHLETIVVAPEADGLGAGRSLIADMEEEAVKQGALSMSLHVMSNNLRARHVYETLGYNEEMIRAIKFLPNADDEGDLN